MDLPPSSTQPHGPEQDVVPTVDLFGIPVSQISLPELLEYIRSSILAASQGGPTRFITYANAHSCNLAVDSQDYLHALRAADLIYTDGNGPRFAAWLCGSWLPPRMTGADWVGDLCQLAQREGYRLYFLGALPGVAEAAASRLRIEFPELQIVGIQDGYFSPELGPAVVKAVEEAQPHILVIGMGSPRQEMWVASHKARLGVPVVWGAGGLFDYASGRLPRPPWWMRRLALEWLGRMMIEPRRLALRYLIGIPVFGARAVRQGILRRRRAS